MAGEGMVCGLGNWRHLTLFVSSVVLTQYQDGLRCSSCSVLYTPTPDSHKAISWISPLGSVYVLIHGE